MWAKTNNELYHYGIQGQKWGKRNGPPYPLGYSKHSPEEKKSMSKDEKYRAKAVDRVSKVYGRLASKYDRDYERYDQKYKKRSAKALGNFNPEPDTVYKVKLAEKDEKKLQKLSDKRDAALIGREFCNNLLEKEIGHIQTMDIAEDKRRRGEELAEELLLSGIATMTASSIAFATGVPAVPIITVTKKGHASRLSKEEIKESVGYAGDDTGSKYADRAINNVINQATKYNAKDIRKSIAKDRLDEADSYSKKAAEIDSQIDREFEKYNSIAKPSKQDEADFNKKIESLGREYEKYLDKAAELRSTDKPLNRLIAKNIRDPLPDKYSMKEQAQRESDRDDGKKVSSYYTSAEKKSKLETALKSDRYDLNFLEAIQNSKILIDGRKSAIDKQYEIYLDDPEAYWDKARKLPAY